MSENVFKKINNSISDDILVSYHMSSKYLFLLILLSSIAFSSCSTTKDSVSETEKETEIEGLKAMISKKSYSFLPELAYPMPSNATIQVNNAIFRNTENTARRIQIYGHGDYIKVSKDSIQAKLSYFGEIQMAGSINPRDNGIRFNTSATNYNVKEDTKKQSLIVTFTTKNTSESFDVTMNLFPTKRATVIVTSSKRTSIRYTGKIE